MLIPVDPLAALRLDPITVTLGGRDYTLPKLPAANWIEATLVSRGRLVGYIPGLLPIDDRARIVSALMAGEIDRTELAEATWDVLTLATGFEWWWVGHRLLQALVSGWAELGGWLLSTGMDPTVRPVGAVLLASLHRFQEGAAQAENSDRNNFYSQLCMPPQDHPRYRELMETVGAVVLSDLAKHQ